jgi:hypothetical protein
LGGVFFGQCFRRRCQHSFYRVPKRPFGDGTEFLEENISGKPDRMNRQVDK